MVALQGPSAPIFRNVLVRAARTIPPKKISYEFISRPPDVSSPLWQALSAVVDATDLAPASERFVQANALDALLTSPYDIIAPSGSVESLTKLRDALASDGLDRVVDKISHGPMGELYTPARAAVSDLKMLDLWDQLAARLIGMADRQSIPGIFGSIKLLFIARCFSEADFQASPTAQPLFAEVALPKDLIGIINKSSEDKRKAAKAALDTLKGKQSEVATAKIKSFILALASYDAISASVRSRQTEVTGVPRMNFPGGGKGPAIPSLDTKAFKIVLNAQGVASVPVPVAQWITTRMGVVNLAQEDVVRLLERLSIELSRQQRSLFSIASAQMTMLALQEMRLVVSDLNNGRTLNFDAAIAAAVNAYPLAAMSALLSGSYPMTPGQIRPAGIADLKVINQQLQKYQLGEIAYIENVLSGEERERVHNRLERTEQQLIVETEESSSTEHDLQTTERFALSQELESMQKESRTNEAGVNISASYGVVSIAAHASTQNTNSAESAIKNARSHTKETVDRAVERIQKRTRRQQTITITNEITETNKHKFSALNGNSVVGLYRYVEKVYWCQTLNYGSRLMLEFMIPEPAAFFLFSQTTNSKSVGGLTPPDDLTITAADIDESTYLTLAAKYKAQVTEPPKAVQYLRIAHFSKKSQESDAVEKITIDDGYEVVGLYAQAMYIYTIGENPNLTFMFGDERWDTNPAVGDWPIYKDIYPGIRGEFTVYLTPLYISTDYSVGISLLLQRTDEAFHRWQIATYNAIADAYRQAKDEYDKRVQSLQASQSAIQIKSDADYRNIERLELRRGALELLTSQHFDSFSAIQLINNIPTIDNAAALSEGPIVQFFEQAFEWNEMTYVFYPYFWGRKTEWLKRLAVSDADPVFSRFLRAGYARVIAPVRKNFENDITFFLETGKIWGREHPGQAPTTHDEDYLSIITEMKEMDAALERGNLDGVPEGAPWQIAVPTPLVCLDSDSVKLPSWELAPSGQPIKYVPSEATCDGVPYNAAQWPDNKAIAQGLTALGYSVTGKDADAFFGSGLGRRTVQAFQRRANELGVAAVIGRTIRVDGVVGPCTLRALTAMMERLARKEWPGPNAN